VRRIQYFPNQNIIDWSRTTLPSVRHDDAFPFQIFLSLPECETLPFCEAQTMQGMATSFKMPEFAIPSLKPPTSIMTAASIPTKSLLSELIVAPRLIWAALSHSLCRYWLCCLKSALCSPHLKSFTFSPGEEVHTCLKPPQLRFQAPHLRLHRKGYPF
jgi:hypothetical protein